MNHIKGGVDGEEPEALRALREGRCAIRVKRPPSSAPIPIPVNHHGHHYAPSILHHPDNIQIVWFDDEDDDAKNRGNGDERQ